MYQTRDIHGQLKYFSTFKEVIKLCGKGVNVCKISWNDDNFSSQRQRWVKMYDGKWAHEDICSGEIYEKLRESEFFNRFKDM